MRSLWLCAMLARRMMSAERGFCGPPRALPRRSRAALRYRMAVIERMPDSPSKKALLVAIQSRMAALQVRNAGTPNGAGTAGAGR